MTVEVLVQETGFPHATFLFKLLHEENMFQHQQVRGNDVKDLGARQAAAPTDAGTDFPHA